MQRLRDLTGLLESELIVVRVRARNENGWDAFSQQNVQGVRIEVEPHEPTGIIFDITTSDKSQVSLSWLKPSDGGSAIIDYTLTVDAASFQITEEQYLLTGLTGGSSYTISLVANNKYGSSLSSEPLIYLAAQEPEQPAAPSVRLYDSYALAEWDAPTDNFAPIIGYSVYLGNVEVTTECHNIEFT
jgi:hypothetical protein